MEDNPCHYCAEPKRHEGCHGTCAEYVEWRNKRTVQCESKRNQLRADYLIRSVWIDRLLKNRMKKRK